MIEPVSRVMGPRTGVDGVQPASYARRVEPKRREEQEPQENKRERREAPEPAPDDGRPHIDVQA